MLRTVIIIDTDRGNFIFSQLQPYIILNFTSSEGKTPHAKAK
jgi:hypothetical protein